MASTPTRLMTFAEFEQLPDTPQGFPYELRHGELFQVAPPKMEHSRVQRRLRRLLEDAAGDGAVVDKEVAFRGLPEGEYRVADVALISTARWEGAVSYLFGAPELVIEILSPSNTKGEIAERAKLCLENGSIQFWVADLDRKQVEVLVEGGRAAYKSGQRIPLFFAEGQTIAVDAIFS